jgi:hypothetical protein
MGRLVLPLTHGAVAPHGSIQGACHRGKSLLQLVPLHKKILSKGALGGRCFMQRYNNPLPIVGVGIGRGYLEHVG